MLKIVILDIFCAYNVPDVYAYLMVAQPQKAMSQLSNAVSRLFLQQKIVSVIAFQFFAKMRKSLKLRFRKKRNVFFKLN